jgi:hypothetical protein
MQGSRVLTALTERDASREDDMIDDVIWFEMGEGEGEGA